MNKALLLLSFLALAPGAGFGALIYEGFESYGGSSQLVGLNGGSGWSGAWAGNTSVTTSTQQLDDPNSQIDGGLRSTLIGGANDNTLLSRSFSSAFTGTVYMSMLIRAENYNNDFIIFQLTDGATGDNTQAMSIGIRNTANNNFFVRSGSSGSGQSTNSSTLATNMTDFFVVGVFTQGVGGEYETVQLYVNPTDSTLATETAAATATSTAPNMTQLSMFTVRTAVFEGDESLYFDELRISDNLSEVFNIPEPSSALLGCFGALLLLRRRR